MTQLDLRINDNTCFYVPLNFKVFDSFKRDGSLLAGKFRSEGINNCDESDSRENLMSSSIISLIDLKNLSV